jgi:hypothetical protein
MNQRKKKKQQPKLWLSYEEVAAYLLDRFAKEFGLSSVKGNKKSQVFGRGRSCGRDQLDNETTG